MRRVALLLLAFLVFATPAVFAAEAVTDRDTLDVNPIPPPPTEEELEADKDLFDYVGEYFSDRFWDLTDIVTIKLGWGNYKSIGVQARIIYPVQIGAGFFEGWVIALEHGNVGVMKEAEIEGGVSIFYPAFIARKVSWQSEEAKKRNLFFGDVGEKKELTKDDLKMFDDENAHPLTSTLQVQLPCLPKVEVSVNWAEIPDFVLSIFNIGGLRVPPAFHKVDGPGDERIPAAASIYWHGQEKEYEVYE